MGNLNINVGLKLKETKSAQSELQSQLNKIHSNLTAIIKDVKLQGVKTKIQGELDKNTSNTTLKISNLEIASSVVGSLQKSLDQIGKTLELNIEQINFKEISSYQNSVQAELDKLSSLVSLNINDIEISGIKEKAEQIGRELSSGILLNPTIVPTPNETTSSNKGKVSTEQSNLFDVSSIVEKQTAVIGQFAKDNALAYSEEFKAELLNDFNNMDFTAFIGKLQNSFDENRVEMPTIDSDRAYAEALNRYKEFIKEVQNTISTGRSFSTLGMFSGDELKDLKAQLKGFFAINDKKGTSIDGIMSEIVDIANKYGFDMGNEDGLDVLQDQVHKLADIVQEYKNLKADGGLSFINENNSESDFQYFTESCYDLIAALEDVEKAKDSVDKKFSDGGLKPVDSTLGGSANQKADNLQTSLNKSIDNALINPDVIARLQEELLKLDADTPAEEFKKLEERIKALSSTDKNIVTVQAAIDKLETSLEKIKKESPNAIDLNNEEFQEAQSQIDRLKNSLSKLKAGDIMGGQGLKADIDAANNSMTKFSNAVKHTNNEIKAANKEQEASDKLASQIYEKRIQLANKRAEAEKMANISADASARIAEEREVIALGESAIKQINEEVAAQENLQKVEQERINNLEKIKSNLQSSLSDRMNTRIDLGIDVSYLHELQSVLNSINTDTSQREIDMLSDAIKGLKSGDSQILQVQKSIDKLNDKIKKLEDKKELDIITTEELVQLDELNSELTKLETLIAELNSGAVKTSTQISSAIHNVTQSMGDLGEETAKTSNLASSMGEIFKGALSTAIGFNIGNIMEDQFSSMKEAVLDVDNSMKDLRRVTNLTSAEYEAITKSSNEMGIALGRTTTETLDTITAFVQLGESVEDSKSYLSEAALVLANVADISVEESISAIISTMKGFGLEAQNVGQIIDTMNEAGNRFALTSADLAEGLRIGSASLKIAGNDLYETSALITAGTEVLQDSNKVANGLKTISMRLRGVAEDGEEVSAALGDFIKDITGVDLTDTNGQFRSTYDIIADISKVWDTLDSFDQAQLLEEIAGKNQVYTKASYV